VSRRRSATRINGNDDRRADRSRLRRDVCAHTTALCRRSSYLPRGELVCVPLTRRTQPSKAEVARRCRSRLAADVYAVCGAATMMVISQRLSGRAAPALPLSYPQVAFGPLGAPVVARRADYLADASAYAAEVGAIDGAAYTNERLGESSSR